MTKKTVLFTILSIFLMGTLFPQDSEARQRKKRKKTYKLQVTVTNLTSNIVFTPPIFATSYNYIGVFHLAKPASEALEMLAEGGATDDLATMFKDKNAKDVVQMDKPLKPGQSVTQMLKGNKRSRLSFASMLLPTNDAFIGLSSVRVRKSGRVFYLYAYDAGTEENDEICANIPGPLACGGGEGYNVEQGEGFVFPHAGIHGEGEMMVKDYGWGNPVAKVVVRVVAQ